MTAGWRWPSNSRKAHYFNEGEIISLCRKLMYAGPSQGDASSSRSSDDCSQCWHLLDRERAAFEC